MNEAFSNCATEAVCNLEIYIKMPVQTSKLIYLTCPDEKKLVQSTCAQSFILVTIVFSQNFNLSIQAGKLKINLPQGKIYSSWMSVKILTYEVYSVTFQLKIVQFKIEFQM